jgi:O-antigen/teichoic acid export membrane protein
MKITYIIKRFQVYFINYLWIIFGYALRLLTIIFIVSKIADKIGLEDFGWYNLGISFFTILLPISALGFNSDFIIKYLVENRDNIEGQKSILGTLFVSRCIFSLIILSLLALWISFSKVENNYWIVFIGAISILFMSSDTLSCYFQWKLKANIYVSVTAISVSIVAILLVIGLYLNLGVFYFMSIYVIERLLTFLGITFVFNKKVFKIKSLVFKSEIFKTLFFQSWPLLLGALLTALYGRFDQFLVKYFLSIEDVGIYGTSIILTQIWLVIPILIVPILYPKITQLRKDNDQEKYKKAIILLYGILNYSAVLVIVFTLIFGDLVVRQLYGDKYLDSIVILYVLIFNLLILFQSQLTTSILILEGKEKYLFKIKLVSVLSNILFNVLFLTNFGVIYAAYSLIFSAFLSWFVLAIFDKTMFNLLKLNFQSFLLPFQLKKIKL